LLPSAQTGAQTWSLLRRRHADVFVFYSVPNGHRLTQIKDRNGNYISVRALRVADETRIRRSSELSLKKRRRYGYVYDKPAVE